MSYNFKSIADVEVVAEPSESANVLIEENGAIKKAPKTTVGGAGGSVEPDMVITLTGCAVWDIVETDCVTITSGTYTDIVEKIWNGTIVDVRVRGTAYEGSYLADANEVKAIATFYGGALWIKWVCSSLAGDRICYRMIKFLEDGSIEAITNRIITGTEE